MINDETLTVADQLAHTLRAIIANLTGRDYSESRRLASIEAAQEALDFYHGHGKWHDLIEESRHPPRFTVRRRR